MRKYGDFTVNFQSVPPPIPPDYWIPLYGIIISTVVGWSIPSMIGWARNRGGKSEYCIDIKKEN